MSRSIEWSPRAESEYFDHLEYLVQKWGQKVAQNFRGRIQEVLDHVVERPRMYPATGSRKNVRRCVVSKQVSLYFRIKKDKIEIVTLFDTRRDPNSRRL